MPASLPLNIRIPARIPVSFQIDPVVPRFPPTAASRPFFSANTQTISLEWDPAGNYAVDRTPEVRRKEANLMGAGTSMPLYEYICRKCHHKFGEVLTIMEPFFRFDLDLMRVGGRIQ
jgi:hypothetical protein